MQFGIQIVDILMSNNTNSLVNTVKSRIARRKTVYIFLLAVFVVLLGFGKYGAIVVGEFLIENSETQPYGRGVVLAGNWEERFLELYDRYKSGEIAKFYFTREKKTDVREKLEELSGPLPTRIEISVDILRKAGIPEENIVIVPEYVRSTRDEAIYVGNYMRENGINGIAILTSKYHSRRACWVFRKMNPDLEFSCIASRYDKFDPQEWWKDRRSIMKVVTEYVKWTGYQMEFLMNRKLAR
jgi:uncharacterized SAM-binding protein YcdF (DUF218 family)